MKYGDFFTTHDLAKLTLLEKEKLIIAFDFLGIDYTNGVELLLREQNDTVSGPRDIVYHPEYRKLYIEKQKINQRVGRHCDHRELLRLLNIAYMV